MSQETQAKLNEQTQKLIDGPLKHIRAAALAAALLPLASVAATPASAQTLNPTPACFSGGTCGIVFNDTNGNGFDNLWSVVTLPPPPLARTTPAADTDGGGSKAWLFRQGRRNAIRSLPEPF